DGSFGSPSGLASRAGSGPRSPVTSKTTISLLWSHRRNSRRASAYGCACTASLAIRPRRGRRGDDPASHHDRIEPSALASSTNPCLLAGRLLGRCLLSGCVVPDAGIGQ